MGSTLLLGFFLGMRHALDADHLAAVGSLAGGSGGGFRFLRLGLSWALGHSTTLVVLGSAAGFMAGPYGLITAGGHALAALLAYACYLLVWASKQKWARAVAAGVGAPLVASFLMPIVIQIGVDDQEQAVFQVMKPRQALQDTAAALDKAGSALVHENILAVCVVALLFGLAHLGPDPKFLGWAGFATAMGLVLGALFLTTGSLLPPIACHVAVNGLNLLHETWEQALFLDRSTGCLVPAPKGR